MVAHFKMLPGSVIFISFSGNLIMLHYALNMNSIIKHIIEPTREIFVFTEYTSSYGSD